jgi:predicted nuclease of restriction endonuclease-like RecB superfamily
VLTNELLRVRRQGQRIVPRYLDTKARARLAPIAATLIAVFDSHRGASREELERAIAGVEHEPRDRLVLQGLAKLLSNRSELSVSEGIDPEAVRDAVFRLAADRRRALGPRDRLDREQVVAIAAERLGVTPEIVRQRMFADLRKNERLVTFRPLSPEALLARYDVALAQGVLLRAVRVELAVLREEPRRVRELFRAARFHGLLHRVRPRDEGWLIELDGPLSLFSAVQRYGLALALFLPSVLRCAQWRLRAELAWGKSKTPAWFELGPEQALVPIGKTPDGAPPELDRFISAFTALKSSWHVEPNDDIVAIPGEIAIVPDLVFTNADTGERVHLEAFGYWSRRAVWQRIETVRRGFPGRIILAIGKQLRVSEEVLEESEAGELYVYRTSLQPRAVLERLDRGA